MTQEAPKKKSFVHQVHHLFRGQLLYAFATWAVLAMLLKFGSDVEAGKYTLALAMSAPIFLFFDLNLRVTRSTDHQFNENYRNYVGLRILCLTVASLITAIVAMTFFPERILVFLGMIAFRIGDSLSNLSFGGYQRMQESDRIGKSLTWKGIVCLSLLAIVIPMSSGQAWVATMFMAAISLTWAITIDLPGAWRLNESDYPLTFTSAIEFVKDLSASARIAHRSLPLGFDALMSSLALNMPRYCIEYFFGTAALGVFGVLSQLAFSIQLLIGAVGHAGVSVLSSLFQQDNNQPFWRLLHRMLLASVGVGVVAIIGGSLVMPELLGWLLRPQLNETLLLFLLLVASGLAGIQRTAGRATQACGSYFVYTMFDVVIFATSAISSLLLVKHYGVFGAATSLILAFAAGLLVTLIYIYGVLAKAHNHKAPEAGASNP
ncbi:lipopolysaccharide biosynthesis protein [Mariniblastus fucicola]|uniref:Polysaccharide biosynthesis protein n=1 Tax=Mariniblastus fucicola TaxID=980251 RepID=A0A5B9P6U1_9BACT|nr:hypothetical protein [Mariniblastus fucicola]QEG22327.1 hypothetical protein MFFC18_22070 [Mariniblastus fucicola]